MIVTPKVLFNATVIPNADTLMYTAPGQTTTIIDNISARNSSGGSLTLNVNIVPNGGSVGAGNLVNVITLAAGVTQELISKSQILNPGDKIYLNASTGADIVARGSGRECVTS